MCWHSEIGPKSLDPSSKTDIYQSQGLKQGRNQLLHVIAISETTAVLLGMDI